MADRFVQVVFSNPAEGKEDEFNEWYDTVHIPELLAEFAAALESELGRPVRLTPAALAAARAHRWPGNIRELRNTLMRAAALHDGPIGPDELLGAAGPAPASPGDGSLEIPRGTYDEMHRALLRRVLAEAGSIRRAAAQLAVPRSTLGAWLREAPA